MSRTARRTGGDKRVTCTELPEELGAWGTTHSGQARACWTPTAGGVYSCDPDAGPQHRRPRRTEAQTWHKVAP